MLLLRMGKIDLTRRGDTRLHSELLETGLKWNILNQALRSNKYFMSNLISGTYRVPLTEIWGKSRQHVQGRGESCVCNCTSLIGVLTTCHPAAALRSRSLAKLNLFSANVHWTEIGKTNDSSE